MGAPQTRHRFERSEFTDAFLRPNVPVLYKRYAADWPAVVKWTPAHLAETHGTSLLPIFEDGPEAASLKGLESKAEISLASYAAKLNESTRPPYLRNVFLPDRLPALAADVRLPEIVEPNWLAHPLIRPHLPNAWVPWFEIFFSAPRTRFPFVHQDRNGLHAWIVQVYGTKKVWVWPPHTRPPRKRGEHHVDDAVDLDRFFPEQEPTVALVEPGDLLFVPHGWWHTVESQSVSISLSGNWVCETNWDHFFQSLYLRGFDLTEDTRRELLELAREVARDHGHSSHL